MVGHRVTRIAVGTTLFAFVFALALGTSGVLEPGGGKAFGAVSTVTVLGGDVSARVGAGGFAAVNDGDVIHAGDTIRTGPESRAVLTYFEGSTVTLEPDTELVVDVATPESDGSTVILMTQTIGRTWHVVSHLLTPGSKYEVRTPAATASVRGTAFIVDVAIDDQTPVMTVTTTEGRVVERALPDPAQPDAPAPEVLVTAGLTASTRQGAAPEQPRPAPQPERKVSVSVDSTDTLVVDSLGRANGMKDGKVVLQTPGARLERDGDRMVVILPDVPDGDLAARVDRAGGSNASAAPVAVRTTVEENGRAVTTVTTRAATGTDGSAVSGVTIARSHDGTTSAAPVSASKAASLPVAKVAEVGSGPDQMTKAAPSGEAARAPAAVTDAKAASDAKSGTDAKPSRDAARSSADGAKTTSESKTSSDSKSSSDAKTSSDAKSPDTTASSGGTKTSDTRSGGSSDQKAADPAATTTKSPSADAPKGAGFLPTFDTRLPVASEKSAPARDQRPAPDGRSSGSSSADRAAQPEQSRGQTADGSVERHTSVVRGRDR